MVKMLMKVVTLVTLLMVEYCDGILKVTHTGFNKQQHNIKKDSLFRYHLPEGVRILNSTKARSLQQDKSNLLGKVIQERFKSQEAKPGTSDDVAGSKRVAPVVAGALSKIAGNGKVQEAVIEKGIEVAGKLVDKTLENIEEAQNKAADFLKKEIKLDITPDKGWETEDMFIPPGYHINAEVDAGKEVSSPEKPEPAYNYPAGMGSVIMNGCWGTGYKKGDPCFDALEATGQCRNMIDGAAFIGVGFDGRGEYSPESRKMSIIQRSCGGGSTYEDFQVPDTMNVHGVYDTSAHMTVFTSRSEYQRYLQREAGVSGSVLGFYAGVKKAWGSSQSGAAQTNLAIFNIDVDRYEIFKDEVKPQDLSRSFLREFVNLPDSYFSPGTPAKFQDFILRWGTHYIKSARFGGHMELQKTQLASRTASKEEFAEESEAEFKSLFWSAGARSSVKSGSSSKSEQKFTSTSVVAQGGSQKIAAVITDMYSPTFKNHFLEWLDSIPSYPKAFKFLMGSIADLVDLRANDLFPDENIDWGCEKYAENLTTDEESGKGYYIKDGKHMYCQFSSRTEMDVLLRRKRASLKRAIEVYMEEGAMSISDISLSAGKSGCQSNDPSNRPSWSGMTTNRKRFHVMFDMMKDLKGQPEDGIDIPKFMSRIVQYSQGKWHTADENGDFHLYDGFNNGGSGNTANQKISIFGLVLTYNEAEGSLVLNSADYTESKKYFPGLSELLKGKQLALAQLPVQEVFQKNIKMKDPIGHLPCNVHWSNGLRFDPSDTGGKCLHFTASTKGTLYVVLSAVPSNTDSWYYVEISSFGVGIYKAQKLKVSSVKTNAVGLGDDLLYQSYFVCVTESTTSTVIEYGKSQGTTDSGDVYLSFVDHDQPIHARFYSFGNGEDPAQIVDSHVISRTLTTTDCKGDTYRDDEEPNCVQRCHEACAPLAGCRSISQGEPKSSECNECRYARNRNGDCVSQCPKGEVPNKNKYCTASFDVMFKTSTRRDDSKIVGLPTLNQYTICFWIEFSNSKSRGKTFKILDYYNKGADMETLRIEVSEEDKGMKVTFWTRLPVKLQRNNFGPEFNPFVEAQNGILKSISMIGSSNYAVFNKDDKWHHFCLVRDSISGETNFFADGVVQRTNPKTRFMAPKEIPLAGGKMHVGGFESNNFPGVLSDLNIWDRLLTNDEIAKMAQSCDGGHRGNVKDWVDIKKDLNPSKYTITAPSNCKKAEQ